MPVFATLLMKKIGGYRRESGLGRHVHPAAAPLRPQGLRPRVGQRIKPYFDMRVNDGESKSEDCFEVRKVARDLGPGP